MADIDRQRVVGHHGLCSEAVISEGHNLAPGCDYLHLGNTVALSFYRCHGSRWRLMTIRRLLKDSKLAPEETQRLCLAYQRALRSLHLVDRNDPIAELVAKKIIEIRIAGVRNPQRSAKLPSSDFWLSRL